MSTSSGVPAHPNRAIASHSASFAEGSLDTAERLVDMPGADSLPEADFPQTLTPRQPHHVPNLAISTVLARMQMSLSAWNRDDNGWSFCTSLPASVTSSATARSSRPMQSGGSPAAGRTNAKTPTYTHTCSSISERQVCRYDPGT